MRIVTRYQANDGTEFASEQACVEYDELCEECYAASQLLPPVELNDGEFVQLDSGKVLEMQRTLVRLFQRTNPNSAQDPHVIWALTAGLPAGDTLISRYIDDSAPGPLRAAWWRLLSIDRKFRQWSQPYYAAHAR